MISIQRFFGDAHAQTLTSPGVPKLNPLRARLWSLRAGVPGMYVVLPSLTKNWSLRRAGMPLLVVYNSGSVEAFDVQDALGNVLATLAVGEAAEFNIACDVERAAQATMADLYWVVRPRTAL